MYRIVAVCLLLFFEGHLDLLYLLRRQRLMCIRGWYCDECLQLFESRCAFRCGRQAMRVLDAAHRYDTANNQSKAASSTVTLSCRNMDDLHSYISDFRLQLSRIGQELLR